MPSFATGSTPSLTGAGTPPPAASSWNTSPRRRHTSRRCPPCDVVLTLDRRVTREGMVSIGGNLYSGPDCTRRRVVEVHALANEIRILEDDKLIAVHPVLEGRGQRRIGSDHRISPPPANS